MSRQEPGNVAQLATLLNLSVPQIYNLANSGIIPKSDNGVWNLTSSATAYIKYLQGRAGEEKRGYAVERTRLTRLQADRAELETAILRADLIPAETVKQVWSGVVASARARLLSLPGRFAATGFGSATIDDLELCASRLVEESLYELANVDSDLYRTARARAASLTGIARDLETAADPDNLAVGSGKPKTQRGRQRGTRKVQPKPRAVPAGNA